MVIISEKVKFIFGEDPLLNTTFTLIVINILFKYT